MKIRILTNSEEQILKIGVRTSSPQKIWVVVSDANKNHTVFTSRWQLVNGDYYYYVRMPLSPTVALVQIYNEANGNADNDSSFKLIGQGIERMPLEKKMDEVDMKNNNVREFIKFAQRFAYHAGTLPEGKYTSRSGKFTIIYTPVILMSNGGESKSPARIGEDSGIIETAQKYFIPYTVPMRFAVLCHEFAHKYLNENMESEIEADLQGLLIYLGLGYPRYEAYQAFLEIYAGTPSQLNAKRRDIVKNFIKKFEENKTLFYE
jgi:hypothetical protein